MKEVTKSVMCVSRVFNDFIISVTASPQLGFLMTGSVDGHIKFWKKQAEGIEFVKRFGAHLGETNLIQWDPMGHDLQYSIRRIAMDVCVMGRPIFGKCRI